MTKYVILEIANTHGGNKKILKRTINALADIRYEKLGIKFQPFNADTIAMSDFKGYKIYKELFFSNSEWKNIITTAKSYCDVWLDIFDTYSVSILKQNIKNISGIKLQSSILENEEVLSSIKPLETTSLKVIINISGLEVSEFEKCLNQEVWKNFSKIIVQIGFQDYPTDIENTGLQKIAVVKSLFGHLDICLADHVDAKSEFAIQVPVWGALLGCNYLEKHFCISRTESKYDSFSSLEPNEVNKFLKNLNVLQKATTGSFINSREKEYLDSTIQIPILKSNIKKGSLLSGSDFIYRRTSMEGLRRGEISKIQNSRQILKENLVANHAIKQNIFRRARIGVIIACRMKSSRLARKALLPINGVPSVERCILNCLKMSNIDQFVLATSTKGEDAVLGKHLVSPKVKFFQGDADDVIKRYLDACSKFKIDIIVRVTADCPVVSHEIYEILLKEHFLKGSDYTSARESAVGTSVEIYNVEALQRVIDNLGEAPYSEYMTWYMKNNSDIFKINLVDLPQEYLRSYRLTLDHDEDLEMFNQLFKKLDENGKKPNIRDVFQILDDNPHLPKINNEIPLTYRDDEKLIALLNKKTRLKKAILS